MSGLTQGIDWGTELVGLQVTYHFLPAGESLFTPAGFVASQAWSAYDVRQFELGLSLFETFTDLDFVETSELSEADLILVSYGDPRSTTLGAFSPPGSLGAGIGAFNSDGAGWDDPGGGLEQGGFGFVTIIHELGHALGLAHPHDTGGASTVFPGVSGARDTGTDDLNQGVFTMMSYNDGWPAGPNGPAPSLDYGYEGTPMAIDIAVLQVKYGVDESYRTGDDVYVLPDENAQGTFYACIWDAGGADTISAGGASAAAVIDLNAATLQPEPGGGGYVSYLSGIHGGFTIANGVVIENATGGSGDDRLVGNPYNNRLNGRSGDDVIRGSGGDDFIFGLQGEDALTGHSGNDVMRGGAGDDVYALTAEDGFDRILGFEAGSDLLDLTAVDEVTGFDDLIVVDTGSGVLVAYGSGSFVLASTSFGSVGADDFLFA